MRDKLRNKLCNPKRREKTKQLTAASTTAPRETEGMSTAGLLKQVKESHHQLVVDTRSVDELVSFINQGKPGAKAKSKSAKAAKRARQRERKKQRKNQEKLRSSQEKEPEKESVNETSTNSNSSREKEKEKNNKGTLSKSQENSNKQVNKDDTETIDSKDKEPQANITTTTTMAPLQPKANGLKRSGEGPDSRMTPDGALHGSLSSSSEGLSTSEHEHSTTSTNSKKRTTGGNLPFLSFRVCDFSRYLPPLPCLSSHSPTKPQRIKEIQERYIRRAQFFKGR